MIALSIGISLIIGFISYKSLSDKLVCTSDKGNITIMYNKEGITGYTASGMSYDLDSQKEYAKEIGMDNYITEFDNWFKTNTSGYCTINGEKVSNSSNNDKLEKEDNTIKEEIQVVGDTTYGYLTIPKDWIRFYDIDGNTSIQYSYASVYIISLNYFTYSAKEYTSYQVYMYYPSDATYLITYWFEAEDGKTHYIALEGPRELNGKSITDYLYIAESFSLNK